MARYYLAAIAAALILPGVAVAQPGQAPFGPGGTVGIGRRMAPLTPEAQRKMARINALRQLSAQHFTAQDLNAALTGLRELEQADQELATTRDRLLDQELNALLSAGPDAAPPANMEEQMNQAVEQHQQRQEQVWQRLTQGLGPDKAGTLRSIVGQAPHMAFPRPGGPGTPFGGPSSTGTGTVNGPNPFGAPGGTPAPGGPGGPAGPGGPGRFPGAPIRPGGMMGMPGMFMGAPLTVGDLADLIQQRLTALKSR